MNNIFMVFVQRTVTGSVFYRHVCTVLRSSLSLLFVCAYCVTGSCRHLVSMFNTNTLTVTIIAVIIISFITTVSN
jgi:putative effector of murein hydrolase LrgA (UPF0299 family)